MYFKILLSPVSSTVILCIRWTSATNTLPRTFMLRILRNGCPQETHMPQVF
jgi:hypothetical protein